MTQHPVVSWHYLESITRVAASGRYLPAVDGCYGADTAFLQQAATGQKQTFGNRGLLPCFSIPVRASLNAVLTATNRKKAVTL